MSTPPLLGPLDQETLGRIIRGEDPWNGWHGASGMSGRYSQSVNRLQKKGYVDKIWDESERTFDYVATEGGRRVYKEST